MTLDGTTACDALDGLPATVALAVRLARDAAFDPAAWLRPGGLLVMDDFTPSSTWPPTYEGRIDEPRPALAHAPAAPGHRDPNGARRCGDSRAAPAR